MFIFACFVQNVKFWRSQFKKVGMAFSEFYLSVLGPLRVLRERRFKALKVPLSESFFTIEMLIFVNFVKTKLSTSTVSEGGRDTFSVKYLRKYEI